MAKIYYILSHANNSLASIQPEEQGKQDQYFISFHHFLVPVKLENIHDLISLFPVLRPVGGYLQNQ